MFKRLLAASLAAFLIASPAFAGSFSGKNATSQTVYWKTGTEAGSSGDPYVPHHALEDGAGHLASFGSHTPTSTPTGWLNSLPFAKYTAAGITLTDGQTAPLQVNASGYLLVAPQGTQTVSVSGTVPVSGTFWQTTQPVSGTFWQSTQPVSLASIPINAAASTAAKQDTGNTSLASIDGKITAVNTGAVTVASSALPTGAASASNQSTGNTSLASIDSKTPALGQALAAGSVPVVLPTAQITTLTPPTTVTANLGTLNGAATESTLSSLNGKVTAVNTGAVVVSSSALPSGASTAAKQPALGTAGTPSADVLTVQGKSGMTALDVNIVSGGGSGGTSSTVGSAAPSVATAVGFTDGTNMQLGHVDGSGNVKVNIATASTVPVSGTFWQATQPVSGTVTANAGTNLNTSALELDTTGAALNVAQGASLGTNTGPMMQGSVTTSAPTYTTGKVDPLSLDTSGNLRTVVSGTVPVSGTFWQTTQPVSAASLPLPSGAATSAKQAALGTAGTASSDVITVQGIASMTKLLVTPDSVALPAHQSTNIDQIGGSSLSLGQQIAANSIPVILPSATVTTLTPPTSVTVTQGTAANLNATVTGTVAATQSGTWTVQPGNTANTTPWLDSPTAATSGGGTPYSFDETSSGTVAQNVKSSAGQIYWIAITNNATSARYVRFFNASTTPTAGSGTPVLRFTVPAGGGIVVPATAVGTAFSTGIGFTITGAAGDTDTTSISAHDVQMNVGYK